MSVFRWMLVILIVLHSLIHLMGAVGAWGSASVQAQIGPPIVPLTGISLDMFGFVWLAAGLALLASAVLLAMNRGAWALVALAGAAISQFAIAFWWTTAWRGTLANILILAVVVWHVTEGTRRRVRNPISGARPKGA